MMTKSEKIDVNNVATIIFNSSSRERAGVSTERSGNVVTISGPRQTFKEPLTYTVQPDGVRGPDPKKLERDGKSLWSAIGLNVDKEL